MQGTKSGLPVSEELLEDYAARLERHRSGRSAHWLHLSRLERANRSEPEIQAAAALLRPLANAFQGEIFPLQNGDIVLIAKAVSSIALTEALIKLRSAFLHDVLFQDKSADEETLVTHFDLESEYGAFREAATHAHSARRAAAMTPGGATAPIGRTGPRELPPEELQSRVILTREHLRGPQPKEAGDPDAELIQTKGGPVALERLVERETLVRLNAGKGPQAWGTRYAVAPRALDAFAEFAEAIARRRVTREEVMPEIERRTATALAFRLLREGTRRLVLQFRLETILSPEFVQLDQQFAPKSREKPALVFDARELREDPETHAYVAAFLSKRGYPMGLAFEMAGDLARHEADLPGAALIELPAPEAEAFMGEMSLYLPMLLPDRLLLRDVRTGEQLRRFWDMGGRLIAGPAADILLSFQPQEPSGA